jgi:hypothetical protein
MPDIDRSMGVDPGYTSGLGGGGAFGITIVEQTDNIIKVMYSHTFKEAQHDEMVDTVIYLIREFNVFKIWVDASAVSFVRSLKSAIDEPVDYQRIIEDSKHSKMDPYNVMTVCPVNFGSQHKQLMSHAKALMSNGDIAINKEQ